MGCCQSTESDQISNTLMVQFASNQSIQTKSGLRDQITKREWIMKYGYPTTDNLFQYEGHILAYSNFFKCPLWVCEGLTKDMLNRKSVDRGQRRFEKVDLIPVMFQSNYNDYKVKNVDRGHMAAAGNHHYSEQALSDTFFLNNICAQTRNVNRSIWKELENHVRKMVDQHGTVHVITGPLFCTTTKYLEIQMLGKNKVAMPTHFFKALCWAGGMEGYIIPNEDSVSGEIEQYKVGTISEIERVAGFRIFEKAQAPREE